MGEGHIFIFIYVYMYYIYIYICVYEYMQYISDALSNDRHLNDIVAIFVCVHNMTILSHNDFWGYVPHEKLYKLGGGLKYN